MLNCSVLKNNAGVVLTGDYWSLRSLRETVHDINERSPLIADRDGLFIGLAYDVRKAYECQREVIKPPETAPEFGVRYGVKILWPVILLQYQMLRQSLSFVDHGPQHQAITYALQFAIESEISKDFAASQTDIKQAWNDINLRDPKTFELLYSRAGLYCSWARAERKRGLATLLASFSPNYQEIYSINLKRGKKLLISPSDFIDWENREWPNPRW